MINIYEKIDLANKKNGLNFVKLEFKIFKKRTGNLSKLLKRNKTTIPVLEKIFEINNLDIVCRNELAELRAFKKGVEDLGNKSEEN